MNVLERWGVRTKVMALSGVLIGLTAVTAFVGVQGASSLQREADETLQHTVPAINLLLNIDRDGYQSVLATSAVANAPEGTDVTESIAAFEENSGQVLTRFAEYQALALGLEGEDALQQEFLAAYDAWMATTAPIVDGTSVDPAADFAAVAESFETWRGTVDLLQAELYEPIVAESETAISDQTGAMRTQILVALALAIVLGGVAAWWLARTLGARVTASARVVGDASAQLDAVSTELTSNAARTAEEANQVADSSRRVDHNMHLVAAAVEELTASVTEISSSATQASAVADRALGASRRAADSATTLGEASSEVGQVVALITSIAEQTNLLALNATIEAARAGAAGSGFAVVANEVKDLARQTADATDVIRQRVEGIQSSSGEIVGTISEVTTVIEEVHGYTATIASAVEEQSITANEIGRSMGEAAAASSTITSGIDAVASAAGGTLAAADATRTTARRMDEASTDLWEVVRGRHTPSAPAEAAAVRPTPPASGRRPAAPASSHGTVASDELQPV